MVWQRYFFKELAKVFFLFLTSFYFLYILIDYSAHAKIFHQDGVTFYHAVLFYLCQFTNRSDILIPIALVIAAIKALTTSALKKEVVALVTGGVALKRLLFPFIAAATLCMLFIYANFQYIEPHSLSYISSFKGSFFKEQHSLSVHHILLPDSSLLLYQDYDTKKRAFIDACWLPDKDTIYRMKTLYPYAETPEGRFVDLIMRQKEGGFLSQGRFDSLHFPKMVFDNKDLFAAVYPPQMQSLSQLLHNISWRKPLLGIIKMNDKEAEILSIFYHKLTSPLICLLAVLAPAPFCLKFGRHLPLFFIYALSLFGLIGFFMVANTTLILGESQVLPPFWAIVVPPITLLAFFGRRYAKL